jgi:ferredoxin
VPAKKFTLEFSPENVDKAITYKLVAEQGLLVNILRAEINEMGGKLIIFLEGPTDRIARGVDLLESNGVKVKELKEYVTKQDTKCTDCGACVSICPVKAFELDPSTFEIRHLRDKCIACGLCLDACPPGAITLSP